VSVEIGKIIKMDQIRRAVFSMGFEKKRVASIPLRWHTCVIDSVWGQADTGG
jgi:hypothetical protein